MAVHLITYDLNKAGQNYDKLYDEIKSLGEWWHYLDSTWLVDSSYSAQNISERLVPVIDKNDYLLVIKVTNDSHGWLNQDAWNWITKHVK
ncbi:MAG: SinR family protein [Clostridiaceae bacterium]